MSKSIIDEIEGERAAMKGTSAPLCGCHTEEFLELGHHWTQIIHCEFHAKSPERLDALCRYVRATEALIKALRPADLTEMSIPLQSARKELGLGEE